MKNFIKAAENIHAYSLKFYNSKVYAINNPYLLEADINFEFPNVEIVNYSQLLIFDDISGLEVKNEDNTLILKQNNIVLNTSYIEATDYDLNDYIKERNLIAKIEDKQILDNITKIIKTVKPIHVLIEYPDIKFIMDITTIDIKNAFNHKFEEKFDIKDLFYIDNNFNKIELYEDCVISYTDDYKLYYFTNTL